ncbi:GNAT family N-acetyltransferase [Bacillus sonorensis]|uniref:GNAT family N-acetyltransferase n=1 Tax=Bacillus sonorensis TaxID=119858 RepID=UPI001B21BA5F|nr:GNAT family N-acetyltransferase [Bacillus sonorensis]MCY7856432.1 GNAT family N-acetyltransferase [Bacillus sonorensis]MCY8025862.1 GNAT family N-acetyltransferase [Bacillus sonorensis]MCY8404841.1 GNAT family N-acetyltransferase [Bacillus sonorensis]GIN66473.1 hypothetical protein J41TS2_18940 [Bacillus sonorensis]
MIKLKAWDISRAKRLLKEESPTFAHAMADGIIAGNVYVDYSVSRRTAIFQTLSGVYHLAGRPPERERNEWLHHLKERTHGRRFTVFSDSPEWDAFLTDGLRDSLQQMIKRT